MACAASATARSFSAAEARPVQRGDASAEGFPFTAGVYAIYSADGQLQYIGISRKVRSGHDSRITLGRLQVFDA